MRRRFSTHFWPFVALLYLISAPTVHATVSVLGYWRLGENDPGAASGIKITQTTDLIGGANLTFVGNAHYANDVAASAITRAGSSLSVNFTNGAYASHPIVSTATDNFGIECWVKPTALGGGQVIAYNGSTGGLGDGGWGLIIAADNTYQVLFGGITAFGTAPATANVWTHLALVEADGTATLYVNGVPTDTAAATPGQLLAGGFALAAPPQAPTSQNFTGLIDEVRVFTFAPGQFSTNDLLINQPILSSAQLVESPAAGTDSVSLVVSPGVSWTASSSSGADWLHPLSSGGTGSTNFGFFFDANPGATRTGYFTIPGRILTITQAGASYVPAGATTLTNFYDVTGLTMDSAGHLYIADLGANVIAEWNTNSQSITAELTGVLPFDLAKATDGNVYFTTENVGVGMWNPGSGTYSNLNVAGLTSVQPDAGIAADKAGNVYVIDQSSLMRDWNVNTHTLTYPSETGETGAGNSGVSGAVDSAGNVYFGRFDDYQVQEWNAQTKTVTTLFYASDLPESLAVDSAGNVYVGGSDTSAIQKWNVINQSMNTVPVPAPGVTTPGAVGVDGAGNLFVFDGGDFTVKELPRAFVDTTSRVETNLPGTGSLPPVIPANANLTGLFYPRSDQPWLKITGVANGVVSFAFTADTSSTNLTAHITLLGQQISITRPNFLLGTTNLVEGPSAGTNSVPLAATAAWTASADVGWLHLQISSGVGSTNIIFTIDANSGPTRTGTLTIAGLTVTITQAGSTYVPVGVMTVNSSELNNPYGLATDGAGNVYIGDTGHAAIQEWQVSSQTLTNLVSSGIENPQSVALDAAGNIYILDYSTGYLVEWNVASKTLTNLVTSGLGAFSRGVAVDAAGNVYTGDTYANSLTEWQVASRTLTNLYTGSTSFQPDALALDGFGNLYFNDSINVGKWTLIDHTVVSPLLPTTFGLTPNGLAVDAAGNVYIADNSGNGLIEWQPATQTITTLYPQAGGSGAPDGVAVDGAGNVYFTLVNSNSLMELPRAFVDNTPLSETHFAGNDSLPPVVPAGANLTGVFYPTSDQPWLTITGVTGGSVGFSFTASPTNRAAHINVLGVSVTVNQDVSVTPPILSDVQFIGGTFQFDFTNYPKATFTVLASTNLALPLSNWTPIGAASNIGDGNFVFDFQPASNSPPTFYRVTSP